jgi:hypothetical protein
MDHSSDGLFLQNLARIACDRDVPSEERKESAPFG